MIQVKILSGKMAGNEMVVRHFPFSVGRDAAATLSLDDAGIWENHLQIDFKPDDGFILQTRDDVSVVINGKSEKTVVLRNGQIIEIGLVKILFSLSPTIQKSLRFREAMIWIALTALTLGQIALIYELLR
ncbi:MAG: FHA domain-containing protein [Verrucomicrobiota bacterium]